MLCAGKCDIFQGKWVPDSLGASSLLVCLQIYLVLHEVYIRGTMLSSHLRVMFSVPFLTGTFLISKLHFVISLFGAQYL